MATNYNSKYEELLPILRKKITLIDANNFVRFFEELQNEGYSKLIPLFGEFFQVATGWNILETMPTVPSRLFQGSTNLTKIKIPDNIVAINTKAFEDCINLKSVEMTNSVKELGVDSFRNTGIETLVLSDNITFIPEGCFADCKNLKEVILPKNLKIIGKGAFENCHPKIQLILTQVNPDLEINQSEYNFYYNHLVDNSPEEPEEKPATETPAEETVKETTDEKKA